MQCFKDYTQLRKRNIRCWVCRNSIRICVKLQWVVPHALHCRLGPSLPVFSVFARKLDLDILPLNLHAKIQVCMSVRLGRRVVTHGHTDVQTHDVKTITPVADAGCNDNAWRLTALPTSCPLCQYFCHDVTMTSHDVMVNHKCWVHMSDDLAVRALSDRRTHRQMRPIFYPQPLTWEGKIYWYLLGYVWFGRVKH